jgi:hypothetical protein
MIREHAFNTAWWGRPVGIVSNHALFDLPEEARVAALNAWDFVELRGNEGVLPAPRALARAGFFHADTQLRFRIGLAHVPTSPSVDKLEVRFADEAELRITWDRMAAFTHERFRHVPGMTPQKLGERYALWATRLAAEAPTTCLAVYEAGALQGWFLSRADAGSLHLTLAVLAKDANVSGHHLYHRAMLAYAARDHRVGRAEFSATNTSVLNIYASLGARFLGVEHCFLHTL